MRPVSSSTGSTLRTPETVLRRIGKNDAKATMNTFIVSSIPRKRIAMGRYAGARDRAQQLHQRLEQQIHATPYSHRDADRDRANSGDEIANREAPAGSGPALPGRCRQGEPSRTFRRHRDRGPGRRHDPLQPHAQLPETRRTASTTSPGTRSLKFLTVPRSRPDHHLVERTAKGEKAGDSRSRELVAVAVGCRRSTRVRIREARPTTRRSRRTGRSLPRCHG